MNLNCNLEMTSKTAGQIAKVILVCEIGSLRRVKIQTPCFPDSRMINRKAGKIDIFMENPENQSLEAVIN